jgi:predicted methyltransferase
MNTKSSGSLIIARILKSDFQEDGILQYDRSNSFQLYTRHEMDTDLTQFVKTMKPLRLVEHKGFENLKQKKGVTHPKIFKERIMRLTCKYLYTLHWLFNILFA